MQKIDHLNKGDIATIGLAMTLFFVLFGWAGFFSVGGLIAAVLALFWDWSSVRR